MQNKPGPLYAGILAGLSGHIALDTKPSEGSITVSLEQPDPVFPLFAGMHRENGIGTLSIMNNESAEIRIVTVNFTAGNYSASLMNCGTVEVLRKRKSVDIPLYADFAPSIFILPKTEKCPEKYWCRMNCSVRAGQSVSPLSCAYSTGTASAGQMPPRLPPMFLRTRPRFSIFQNTSSVSSVSSGSRSARMACSYAGSINFAADEKKSSR